MRNNWKFEKYPSYKRNKMQISRTFGTASLFLLLPGEPSAIAKLTGIIFVPRDASYTARIGILAIRVYVWVDVHVTGNLRVWVGACVCVSSHSSVDVPGCLVGRYDGYTTAAGSMVMHTFTWHRLLLSSCLVSRLPSRPSHSHSVSSWITTCTNTVKVYNVSF